MFPNHIVGLLSWLGYIPLHVGNICHGWTQKEWIFGLKLMLVLLQYQRWKSLERRLSFCLQLSSTIHGWFSMECWRNRWHIFVLALVLSVVKKTIGLSCYIWENSLRLLRKQIKDRPYVIICSSNVISLGLNLSDTWSNVAVLQCRQYIFFSFFFFSLALLRELGSLCWDRSIRLRCCCITRDTGPAYWL